MTGWEFEKYSAGYGQKGTDMRQKRGRIGNVKRKTPCRSVLQLIPYFPELFFKLDEDLMLARSWRFAGVSSTTRISGLSGH